HTPREIALEHIAKIHFWEVNIARYSRGSQGISDATAKALMLARGIRPGNWLPDVSVDWKAFVMGPDEFAAKYPTFFGRAPGLPEWVVRAFSDLPLDDVGPLAFPNPIRWKTKLA